MAIDLLEFRHTLTAHAVQVADNTMSVVQEFSALDAGSILVGLVALLGAFELHRRWVKGKGYRMAVEQERQRVKDMLSEGITDLILGWECNGKLSHQQGDKLYMELSKKLELPGLIPPQRRFKIVKNEIKTRMKSTGPEAEKARKKVNIPGDKPVMAARKKFRQTTGSLLQKFWKKA